MCLEVVARKWWKRVQSWTKLEQGKESQFGLAGHNGWSQLGWGSKSAINESERKLSFQHRPRLSWRSERMMIFYLAYRWLISLIVQHCPTQSGLSTDRLVEWILRPKRSRMRLEKTRIELVHRGDEIKRPKWHLNNWSVSRKRHNGHSGTTCSVCNYVMEFVALLFSSLLAEWMLERTLHCWLSNASCV